MKVECANRVQLNVNAMLDMNTTMNQRYVKVSYTKIIGASLSESGTAMRAIYGICIYVYIYIYRTFAKKGPWAVHLTHKLDLDRGMGRYSNYHCRSYTQKSAQVNYLRDRE